MYILSGGIVYVLVNLVPWARRLVMDLHKLVEVVRRVVHGKAELVVCPRGLVTDLRKVVVAAPGCCTRP